MNKWRYQKITLFTHVNLDGDTIGFSIALKELIKLNLPGIKVKISGDIYPACGEIIYMFIDLLNLKFNKITLEGIHIAIWTDTSGMVERCPTDTTRNAIEWIEQNGVNRNFIIKSLELATEDKDIIKELVSNASIQGDIVYKVNNVEIPNYICRASTEMFFTSIE